SWTGFFRDLTARGLDEVYLVTSDAHLGIQHAISDVLPNASWQRCRTHFAKRSSPAWCPRRNGRHYRRCFTPSFNNPMISQYRTKPVMSWRFVKRNFRMLLATWKKLWMSCWRLPTRRNQYGRKSGLITPPNDSIEKPSGAPSSWVFSR